MKSMVRGAVDSEIPVKACHVSFLLDFLARIQQKKYFLESGETSLKDWMLSLTAAGKQLCFYEFVILRPAGG
jgi:hypothetical protein